MGIRNYLIGGVSGAGKTTVCNELQRRGYHAIHGDRELAYQGDPETPIPTWVDICIKYGFCEHVSQIMARGFVFLCLWG